MIKHSGMTPPPDQEAAFGQPAERGGGPSPVDVHVGNRIRMRRTLLQMSQEKLGEALGLTFQQVQKYERGANRVSASRLFDIARVLGVQVSYFFDELALSGASSRAAAFATGFAEAQDAFGAPSTPDDLFARKETVDLVRAYYRIDEPTKRRKVLDLIKTMGPD